MLILVDPFVGYAIRVSLQKGGRDFPVHFGDSQGRAKAAAVVHRYFPEVRRCVVCAEYGNHLVALPLYLLECIGRDLPGEDIPGMGHNEGNRFLSRTRHGIPEKCLHRSLQGFGGVWIELTGHGRRPARRRSHRPGNRAGQR